jgi:hypothetical protein
MGRGSSPAVRVLARFSDEGGTGMVAGDDAWAREGDEGVDEERLDAGKLMASSTRSIASPRGSRA